MSRDPIGEDGGENVYAYVKNNALTIFDPLGLWNENVHLDKTLEWSKPYMLEKYATIIAVSDNSIDGFLSGESPMPGILGGDQDRHLAYKKGGGKDSRDWYYDYYMEKVLEYLQNNQCKKASESFGYGLHSKQDISSHHSYPNRDNWPKGIYHPFWWDYYGEIDSLSNDSLKYTSLFIPDDNYWRRKKFGEGGLHAPWNGSAEQRRLQKEAINKVEVDTRKAINDFVEAVRNSCCKKEILGEE